VRERGEERGRAREGKEKEKRMEREGTREMEETESGGTCPITSADRCPLHNCVILCADNFKSLHNLQPLNNSKCKM